MHHPLHLSRQTCGLNQRILLAILQLNNKIEITLSQSEGRVLKVS